MTRDENALIQALRLEIQSAFREVQDSIIDLTASQRAHLAVHDEREKARAVTDARRLNDSVTKRWVVGVMFSAVSVLVASMGVAVGMMRLFMS